MAATQMVLFELGWQAPSADCWYDPQTAPCEMDYSNRALSVVVADWVRDTVEKFLGSRLALTKLLEAWSKAWLHRCQ